MESDDPPIAYTVKTGDRKALREALDDLDLSGADGGFEVILYPARSKDYSIRSESAAGTNQALVALDHLNSAVVRVYREAA